MGRLLSHTRIWSAIDALARRYGHSVSGLAQRAGLDPTTFNKSKRVTSSGRARWPNTESLAKILDATGASLDEFFMLVEGYDDKYIRRQQNVPLIGFAQAGSGGFFDDGGFPAGEGWEEVVFPDIHDENVYALEISGDSMLPVYRDGDTIIVSPSATVRRGDRVVVKTTNGEVMAKVLGRKTAHKVDLQSLNPEFDIRSLPLDEILWIARIIWASQ